MAATGPRRFRVGGSGFTVFHWDNKLIGSARQIAHTSPTPVADAVPIQPLDARHPQTIITPAAVSMGTMTLELYELYGSKVWEELKTFANIQSDDLQDIFEAVANTSTPIKMTKIITPPKGALNGRKYEETYHNCVITNITDNETIEVGTMEVLKQIEVAYARVTRA